MTFFEATVRSGVFGLIIGLIFSFGGLWLAAIRSPRTALGKKPLRVHTIQTSMSAKVAHLTIAKNLSVLNGLRVAVIDNDALILVYEESPHLFSWGFFHVVRVMTDSTESTSIQIATSSKLTQVGAIVDRSHEKVVAGLKTSLLLVQEQ